MTPTDKRRGKITDKMRLDWLEKHSFPLWIGVALHDRDNGQSTTLEDYPDYMPAHRGSGIVRKAIDAAILAERRK